MALSMVKGDGNGVRDGMEWSSGWTIASSGIDITGENAVEQRRNYSQGASHTHECIGWFLYLPDTATGTAGERRKSKQNWSSHIPKCGDCAEASQASVIMMISA